MFYVLHSMYSACQRHLIPCVDKYKNILQHFLAQSVKQGVNLPVSCFPLFPLSKMS